MQNSYESDSEDELPAGWEQKSTEDGNVFYVNPHTNKTQWTHPTTGKKKVIPKELPFGWSKIQDEDGKTLYIHKETGSKTHIDPRLAFAKEEKRHVNDFRQRFDASSTAYQILHGVDLSGKIALITGSNAGIGFETAKSLARHGCTVIFANRNMEATKTAMSDIVKETNAAAENLRKVELDLASLNSVKKCALEVRQNYDHIDMLVLNAGVFGLPYTETEDKLETLFQVNHLSHMYLALLLEPLLKKGSRVVFVSSESHRTVRHLATRAPEATLAQATLWSKLEHTCTGIELALKRGCRNTPFASLKNIFITQNLAMHKEDYYSMMAYNNTKLYNVITAKMLSDEWKAKGIAVNSLHPGNMVFTNLSKSWWLYRLAFMLVRPFTKSMQQAAATTVYVATAEDLEGVTGLYFNNCFYCEESALARDKEIAKSVYDLSLKMIAERMGTEYIEEYMKRLA